MLICSRSTTIKHLHDAVLAYSSSALISSPFSSSAAAASSSSSARSRLARRRRLPPLDIPSPPESTAKTRPTVPKNDVAPYLPVITRERNFLIANLHANLYSAWRESRQGKGDWDSFGEEEDAATEEEVLPSKPTAESLERIWESIAAIITYPDSAPHLPRVPLHSSSRPDDLDAPFRSSPSLSLFELRKAFTLLSTATATKANLARLLVLAEIIAIRSSRSGFQTSATNSNRDGREFDGELAGGGMGLRPKDWKVLYRFTGLSYRHPREASEVKTLLRLLNQSHQLLGARLDLETYNMLLHIAAKANLHSLYDGIEERMKKDGFEEGDLATLAITLNQEFKKGHSMETLRNKLLIGIRSVSDTRTARENASLTIVFNTMANILSRTGHSRQAKMLLDAMSDGLIFDLNSIFPAFDTNDDATAPPMPFYFVPPPPTQATYSLLVQSYSHIGNPHAALNLIKEMSSRRTFTLTEQLFSSLFKSFSNHLPRLPPGIATPSPSTSNYIPPSSHSPPSYFTAIPRPRPAPLSKTPYSLSALQKAYNLYISLPLPAPHPKTLFWIILAFEKAGRGRPAIVLGVWRELEDKWSRQKEWRVDTRMRKRVAWWEEEMERRLLEGDALDRGEGGSKSDRHRQFLVMSERGVAEA